MHTRDVAGLQVIQSNETEASRKGLYALATLLRNNAAARQHFYQQSGVTMLTELLQEPRQSEAVQRKVLNLVSDLSQADLHAQVDWFATWHCVINIPLPDMSLTKRSTICSASTVLIQHCQLLSYLVFEHRAVCCIGFSLMAKQAWATCHLYTCSCILQTSKEDRHKLLAALHPQACDSSEILAEEALLAVKGVLECSPSDAKDLADSSGTHTALHSMQQQLKSHLSSYAHVESYVADNIQCQRDLLQLCNDIDNMPILTGSNTISKEKTDHDDL